MSEGEIFEAGITRSVDENFRWSLSSVCGVAVLGSQKGFSIRAPRAETVIGSLLTVLLPPRVLRKQRLN